MQFSTVALALVAAASSVVAAPIEARQNAKWTLQSFTRTCNAANTSCTYTFSINPNNGQAVTACKDVVNAANASRAPTMATCGAFKVSSQWSGQFGAGKGFTTFALVSGGYISYPGYTDSELVNGKAVSPNKSFPVYKQ